MIRITLIQLASFLLPFLLFFIWRWQSRTEHPLHATPTAKLTAAGVTLAVLAFLVLVFLDSAGSGRPGQQYVPPRVVDGEMVPGHFVDLEPEDDAGEDDPEDPQ